LKIDKTFLLDKAKVCLSPNSSERKSKEISLLVIHNISLPPGKYGGDYIEKFFTNQLNSDDDPYFEDIIDLTVSSHLLIKRDGSITQFVPFNKKAWHAGVSIFKDREDCNEFSIGIELEGTDETPYEKEQYNSLIMATKALMSFFPDIKKDRIVGHSDIAPDRKTDPGKSFDWEYYLSKLN
jgi:AmpD protein|tara:strand:- start:696 stop:1238 length:543 start_codon:yes stop_codon:yes gene_type:complete